MEGTINQQATINLYGPQYHAYTQIQITNAKLGVLCGFPACWIRAYNKGDSSESPQRVHIDTEQTGLYADIYGKPPQHKKLNCPESFQTTQLHVQAIEALYQ